MFNTLNRSVIVQSCNFSRPEQMLILKILNSEEFHIVAEMAFKVIQGYRKSHYATYNFILHVDCNYVSISHRFLDTSVAYLSKMVDFNTTPVFHGPVDGTYRILYHCLMNTFIREKQTIRTGTTDIYKERRKLW